MALTTGLTLTLTLAVLVCFNLFRSQLASHHHNHHHHHNHTKVCTNRACTLHAARILENMNRSVEPCDDFWKYSCGGWSNKKGAPSSEWGELSLVIFQQLVSLLSKNVTFRDSSSVKVAKTFYQSCMNKEAIEREGDTVLTEIINATFNNFPSDLTSRLIKVEKLTLSPLLILTVNVDHSNTSRDVLQIHQPSLNLRRFRYEQDGVMKSYSKLFIDLMSRLLPGVSLNDLETWGTSVIQFETSLALCTMTPAQKQNISNRYHDTTLATLQRRYPELHWRSYVEGVLRQFGVNATIHEEERIVSMADLYLDRVFPLLRETHPNVIKDYFMWSAVQDLVYFTSGELRQVMAKANFTSSAVKPNPFTCALRTRNNLPHAVGHMYAAAFGNDTSRKIVINMTRRIISSLGHRIQDVNWLSSTSKQLAAKKLQAMVLEVGLPSKYKNSSVLDKVFEWVTLNSDTYLSNYLTVYQLQTHLALKMSAKPRQHLDFFESSAEANAYYVSLQNAIFIPTGVFQRRLVSEELPPSVVYGGLGSVIGHEVTHGFDSDGRMYDEHGNLKHWWSQEDGRRYEERAQCYVSQYDQFESRRGNASVDGDLTLDENIADNAGVATAFGALEQLSQETSEARTRLPGLTNLTYRQLFFLSYAQIWCGHDSARRLYCKLRTDEHSPAKYRVLGTLVNSPDFAEAFTCPVGSNMNPQHKCQLW